MNASSPLKTFTNLPLSKQEKITSSAIREFSEKGYHGASINAMVREIGIAKGSIYRYFEDKENLFLYVFSDSMDKVKQYLKNVRSQTEDQPVQVRLEKTLEAGVRFIEEHPSVYRLYVTFLHDESMPLRSDLLSVIRRQSIEFIISLLDTARSRGELKQNIDLDKAGFIIDAVMDRFLLARSERRAGSVTGICSADKAAVSEYIRQTVLILCKGFVHD